MKLHHPSAEIFVPDGTPLPEALARITHLGIGAHQNDLELMAFHGILACHAREDRWFGGVTCTDGSGGARSGRYAAFREVDMVRIRHREQRDAAEIGQYGAVIQLDHPSVSTKGADARELVADLMEIIAEIRPRVVYTHNLADKDGTRVAVALAALRAMRELPLDRRPKQVIGCEVHRDLDWLPDEDKVLMDVSGFDHLASQLNGTFDSRIAGGKRYDLATAGRRAANATFLRPDGTDSATQLIFGMDLTPLVVNESMDIISFTCDHIEKMQDSVRSTLESLLPGRE